MTLTDTPLRTLVKSYTNGLLNRQQYLEVRQQLLKKLSIHGHISHDDLQNFLKIYLDKNGKKAFTRRYSASDWIIIALGLMAAIALGVILFS